MVFLNVRTISKTGTKVITDIEASGEKVVIARFGKPVFILTKASGRERGKKETVSNFRNFAPKVLADAEKSGKPLIITRDDQPVAVLLKVTANTFKT